MADRTQAGDTSVDGQADRWAPSAAEPRVWLITGASRGLGRDLAATALVRGDRVVATARDPRQLAVALGERPELLALPLDVTDADAADSAVAAAVEAYGRIDVVVNNAGFGLFGAVEEAAAADLERVFATNVTGAFNVSKAALPHLRAQRSGHLLNVSSLGGFSASAGWGVYGASKAALEGLSEAWAAELAPLGISVTIVEPGFFRTEFLSEQSLHRPEQRIADYDASVNREAPTRMNNRQPGDPRKAAEAIHQIVGVDHPPLRLALGADALGRARAKLIGVSQDLHQWEDLSRSTPFTEDRAAGTSPAPAGASRS